MRKGLICLPQTKEGEGYNRDANHNINVSFLLAETCAFPKVIYTNFASSAPYVYKNASGHIKGLFGDILREVIKSNYSNCEQQATIDFATNGRNGWAEKKTIIEMKKDAGDSHISFPIFGGTYSTTYQGYAFVPVVPHPGVVHFTIKNNLTDQAQDIGKKVWETWPLFSFNVLLLTIVGFCIWAVVSPHSYVSFLCL